MGRVGRWGVSESVAAAAHAVLLCCVDRPPLIVSTLTDKFPEDDIASANSTQQLGSLLLASEERAK